jgi:ADP-ribose pyrophosphatase
VAIEGSEPDVLLVRQYRPALDRETLEIPAGMRDVENEDPLVTAQRELQEEVGRIALHWTLLGTHVSAPGISNSHVTLFLAEGLSEVPIDRHGPEEHHMVVERHPLASVVARARDGDLGDAKTVIGVMLADAILRER